MSKTDAKLETLKSLIDPLISGLSPQKRKYAKDLFSDIVTDLNKAELFTESLQAKLNGFNDRDEYVTMFHKAMDILILMGAGDIQYDFLSYKNMRWICEHNENQTKPLTFNELYAFERALRMFEGLEDRLPESTNELRDYFKKDSE